MRERRSEAKAEAASKRAASAAGQGASAAGSGSAPGAAARRREGLGSRPVKVNTPLPPQPLSPRSVSGQRAAPASQPPAKRKKVQGHGAGGGSGSSRQAPGAFGAGEEEGSQGGEESLADEGAEAGVPVQPDCMQAALDSFKQLSGVKEQLRQIYKTADGIPSLAAGVGGGQANFVEGAPRLAYKSLVEWCVPLQATEAILQTAVQLSQESRQQQASNAALRAAIDEVSSISSRVFSSL